MPSQPRANARTTMVLQMTIPNDPDALLTRKGAAEALNAAGFPVAEKTLATKATRGGGPPYRRFGARPLYRWADALAWAQAKLGPTVTSTSELDTARAPTISLMPAEPCRTQQPTGAGCARSR
jgi:hypothetical protein